MLEDRISGTGASLMDMPLGIDEALEDLGIEIVAVSATQFKAACPVHELFAGHEDRHPSWYINRDTGAWHCFSCKAGGGLGYLYELLGADPDTIRTLRTKAAVRTVEKWKELPEEKEAGFTPYISEYAFNNFSHPSERMLERKRITPWAAEALNIRWDSDKKCFLLPAYDTGGVLLGWQEKSTGYFNNVPDGLPRNKCLFGHSLASKTFGPLVVVESPLDVGMLVSMGYRAVAIFGSYGSKEQLNAVQRMADTVILAFDNDEAGISCTTQWLRELAGHKVKVVVYDSPNTGEDPGELSEEDLRRLIEGASYTRNIHGHGRPDHHRFQGNGLQEDKRAHLRQWVSAHKVTS